MALSEAQRKILRNALADKDAANAIADMIDAAANEQAADVTELGTLSGTYAIPAEPTGAEVDASVQVVASKVDEIINALQAAGLMAGS